MIARLFKKLRSLAERKQYIIKHVYVERYWGAHTPLTKSPFEAKSFKREKDARQYIHRLAPWPEYYTVVRKPSEKGRM